MRTALASIVLFFTVSAYAQLGEWRELTSWSGGGNTTTEQFTVRSSFWRIRYSTTGTGNFTIRVFDADSREFTFAPVNVHAEGPTSGLAHLNTEDDGPSFYLEIVTTGPGWNVAIEDQNE